MPEFQLHCFAQSGNSYRAALMLNLISADWKPVFVDFFGAMPQRTAEWRESVNDMGEAPVLDHNGKKLTQSGVILTYLADLSGHYKPQGLEQELESLRWILFDNQKVNGFLGPYRFLRNWARPAPDQAVLNFLKGRIDGNLAIVNARLGKMPFLTGGRPTIADISMVGYMFYPPGEFGFDIAAEHKNIAAWLDRMKAMPRWAHPYDLMPGHPMPGH
jgi:glutathione S-transferase